MRGETGQPVFFDPAVYYAHREIELAFMTLFDRQPSNFYTAYEEVFPLEARRNCSFALRLRDSLP